MHPMQISMPFRPGFNLQQSCEVVTFSMNRCLLYKSSYAQITADIVDNDQNASCRFFVGGGGGGGGREDVAWSPAYLRECMVS